MAAYLCSNVPEFIKLENWPPSSSETPPSVCQASPQPTQTLMDVKHWERSECTLHTGHSWTWNIEKDLSALNILDTHGPETLRKIWVHSTYWTLMEEKNLSALNILDSRGRETLRKISVHSTYWTLMDVKHWERSECTQHTGHSWTWNTEKDLSALNIGMHTAWRWAQDREQWQQTMEAVMLHDGACPQW